MGAVIDIVDWYKEILSEDPSSTLFVPLAEVLYSRGEYAEVVRVCRQGFDAHPLHLRGRTVFAMALRKLGRTDEAQSHVNRIYSELVKDADIFQMVGEMLREDGDDERANRMLEAYRILWPEDAEGESSGAVASLAKPRIVGAPVAGESRNAVVLDFLDAWLENIAQREVRPPATVRVFDDEDREALKRALAG